MPHRHREVRRSADIYQLAPKSSRHSGGTLANDVPFTEQFCEQHESGWAGGLKRVLSRFFSSFVCLWFMMNIDWYLWHEYSSSAIAAGIYCGQVNLIPHTLKWTSPLAIQPLPTRCFCRRKALGFVQHCSPFWWRCQFHCTADGREQQKVTSRGDADKSFDVFPKDHKGHGLVNKYIPGTSRHRASNGNHSMPCVCLCPGCAMGQWSKC